eukprot:419578_1
MEEFFKTYDPDHVAISQNNKKISSKTSAHKSIYGAQIVSSGDTNTHCWTFKIIETVSDIVIGIDEASELWVNQWYGEQTKTLNYSYCNNGQMYSQGQSSQYGKKYRTGDIISMVLNMSTNTLIFTVNNTQYKEIKIKRSNIGYKMCIYFENVKDSLELLSYSRYRSNSNAEQKETCPFCPKYQKQIATEKEKFESKCLQYEILQTEQETIRKMKSSQEKTIESLKNEVHQYQKQVTEMQNDNQHLQIRNATLMEEQKQLQIENEKLKSENTKLKLQNIDTSKYEEWSWEEIFVWILSLEDSRYAKYSLELKKALAEEQPCGKDLVDVNANDVKGWGVVSFRDKKDLHKSIQQLVARNSKRVIDEGSNAPTAYI